MASCDNILPFIKPGWVGVEIGVQWGVSAEALLLHGVHFLYLVDPWENYEGYAAPSVYWNALHEDIYLECKDRLAVYGEGRRFVTLRLHSDDAVEFVPEVDFVWIDGNHYYEWVMDDCEDYWPLVRPGGILCGHDYDDGPSEVREAVTDFARNHDLTVETVPQCWIIRRPA